MSFKAGRVFGVTIRVHYTLLFIFFLIVWSLAMGYMPQQFPGLSPIRYWIIGTISGFILLLSVVIHELCHSIVAIKLGLPIKRITLFFLGGAAEMAEEPKRPDVEFKMALVGPLSSFAIAALFGGLWYIFKTVSLSVELLAIAQYGAVINLILGGFNLLPAFPMDGGRIFRSIAWKYMRSMIKATQLATKLSVGFAYAMMFGGFLMIIFRGLFNGLWIIFIGWFIKSGAEAGLSQTIITQALSGTTVSEIMSSDVVTVDFDTPLHRLVTEYFLTRKFAGYPVRKDGAVVGMVTMDQVKRIPRPLWEKTAVRDVMKPLGELVIVEPETPASDAFYKMSRKDEGRILVMKNGELNGIVSRKDFTHLIKTKIDLEYGLT
ncbi:MAG: site-2 protease family protein [Candidatus Bathyarchaeia archaeon]